MEEAEALRLLQDEIVALRQTLPDLRLRKSRPPAAGAPFPITLAAPVGRPPAAALFDVESLDVRVVLERAALSAGAPEAGVRVEVGGGALPAPLRAAVAADLHAAWAARLRARRRAAGGGGAAAGGPLLGLAAVWEEAAAGYGRLLSLRPEYLERYEAVDAAGASVRRVAVLSDTATLAFDAAAARPPPPPPLAAAPSSAGAADAAAPVGGGAARPAARSRAPVARPPARGAAPAAGPAAAAAELLAVARRYGELKELVGTDAGAAAGALPAQLGGLRLSGAAGAPPAAPRAYALSLLPTDPEWRRRAEGGAAAGAALPLVVRVANAGAYPAAGSFAVELAPGAGGLPPGAARAANAALAERAAAEAGRADALRAMLRHVENRAGELLFPGGGGSDSEASTSGGGGSASGSSSSGAAEGNALKGSWYGDGRGGGGGALRLVLEGLRLGDVNAVELLKLTVQVACGRCRASADVVVATPAVGLAPGAAATRAGVRAEVACGGCGAALALAARPRLVHARANALALVAAEGCAPVGVLPGAMLAATCACCGGAAVFRGARDGGAPNERACGSCGSQVAFRFDSWAFEAAPPPPSAARPRRAAGPAGGAPPLQQQQPRGGGEPLLVPGTPLPGLGACAHYRHSYRLLRFPCCGRRFPCDICHELAVPDGHEARWASRMVCGYCSVEQPVAGRCRECGRRLTTSAAAPEGRSTRFWEGGRGQRDRRRLSRRDPARYRNSAFKTRSAKSTRVGPKMRDRDSD